jgi:hypothetical protein
MKGNPLIHIEYRYPWARGAWLDFGIASREDWARELLEACLQHHPGCECRIQAEGPEDVTTEVFTPNK